jgi:hypothetical protein
LTLVSEPLRYFKTVVTPDKLRISQAYLDCANPWSDLGVMAKTAFVLLAPWWQMRIDGALRRWETSGGEQVKRPSCSLRKTPSWRSVL